MTHGPRTRFLGPALAGLCLVACGQGEIGRERPDVLLITIDTARVDRFSFMGPSPVETPAIDSLAAEATVFTQALSPAPLTLVAHASLLTGQLPITHGIRNNGAYRLAESATTLAELLAARGYRTAAFVGAAVLASDFGLDQGFEHYDDEMGPRAGRIHYAERRAEEIVERALAWRAAQGEAPSFVWVHFFDPHYPWQPPPPERDRFLGSPYEGEIAYVDRQVGVLRQGYRALGRWRDAVVVLTADHGESLDEHGEASHGVFVYDVTQRVPLVLRVPAAGVPGRAPAAVAEQVQLIDVLPTLASLLGLGTPEGVEGRDLTPLLDGRSAGEVPAAYLESFYPRESFGWSPLRGLRDGRWKLIVGAAEELYDLESDPGEEHDVAPENPQKVRAMKRRLAAFREREATAERSPGVDEETLAAIRSLGYVGSSGAASETTGPAVDPRRHIRLLPTINAAVDRFDRGFVDEALEDLRRGRRADPGNPWIHQISVELLRSAGHTRQADAVCEEFLARVRAEIRGDLGRLCTDAAPADAAPPLAPVRGTRPGADVGALLAAAERFAGGRDPAAVKRVLTEINHLSAGGDPTGLSPAERMRLAEAANRVGGRCWESGAFADAAHAYSLALGWMPDDARLHYNLGLAWERLGVADKALSAHRRALELDPRFSAAARHRDLIAAELDRWQRQIPAGGG